MPWEYGKYKFYLKLEKDQYLEYKMSFESDQGDGIVNIKNSGNDMKVLQGFKTLDEQILILTHPVIGYYKLFLHRLIPLPEHSITACNRIYT